MSQKQINTMSVLAEFAVSIDLNAIASEAEALIGSEKVAAYEQYLAIREQARDTMKCSKEYRVDAEYLENLMKDNFNKLIALPSIKAILPVAYAEGREQIVYDELRNKIVKEIVATDHGTFGKYEAEYGDCSASMLIFLNTSADEARQEADSLWKQADNVLKDQGLGEIIVKREEARTADRQAKAKK